MRNPRKIVILLYYCYYYVGRFCYGCVVKNIIENLHMSGIFLYYTIIYTREVRVRGVRGVRSVAELEADIYVKKIWKC